MTMSQQAELKTAPALPGVGRLDTSERAAKLAALDRVQTPSSARSGTTPGDNSGITGWRWAGYACSRFSLL